MRAMLVGKRLCVPFRDHFAYQWTGSEEHKSLQENVIVLPEDSFSQDIFRKRTMSQVKHMGVAGELIASERLKHRYRSG